MSELESAKAILQAVEPDSKLKRIADLALEVLSSEEVMRIKSMEAMSKTAAYIGGVLEIKAKSLKKRKGKVIPGAAESIEVMKNTAGGVKVQSIEAKKHLVDIFVNFEDCLIACMVFETAKLQRLRLVNPK